MKAGPIKNRSYLRGLIKAEEMIHLLQDDILNKDPDHKHMSPQRVNAIKLLLGKSLPDLKAMEISGDAENPINTSLSINFVEPKALPENDIQTLEQTEKHILPEVTEQEMVTNNDTQETHTGRESQEVKGDR